MKKSTLNLMGIEAMPVGTMQYIVGGGECATEGGTKTHDDGTRYSFSADTKSYDDKTNEKTGMVYHVQTDKSTATVTCEKIVK